MLLREVKKEPEGFVLSPSDSILISVHVFSSKRHRKLRLLLLWPIIIPLFMLGWAFNIIGDPHNEQVGKRRSK